MQQWDIPVKHVLEAEKWNASGSDCLFISLSDFIGAKIYTDEGVASGVFEWQHRGYDNGLAPGVGTTLFTLKLERGFRRHNQRHRMVYYFITEKAIVAPNGVDAELISDMDYLREEFESILGEMPSDYDSRNVGYVDDKLVMIDWGWHSVRCIKNSITFFRR